MNAVDLDLLVERAASKALRRRQYDTFALMEPSLHMNLDGFRQIAEVPETDYTSVRTVLGAFAEMARPRTYLEIGTRRGHSLCMVASCAPDRLHIYSFELWIHEYAGEANPGLELIKSELRKLNLTGQAQFFAGDSKDTVRAFFHDPTNPQEVDLAEVIIDGETGFLVPPNNPPALANAIVEFYKKHMEKEFEKRVKKEKLRYSWSAMVKTIEELTAGVPPSKSKRT